MKKLLSVFLILAILCASVVSMAEESEDWTCPNCGKENAFDSAFCPKCGTQKPEQHALAVCPNCGDEYEPDAEYLFCRKCGTSLTAKQPVSNIEVGGIISFGSYEQDNNLDNGPEDIEWIVLDVQDGKALLLSKYGLDAKPYNTEKTDITWEQCTLRAWLNQDFLNTAFSEKEQSAILTTHVDNSDAQGISGWGTTGGNDTEDLVFLLSCHEAYGLYFTSDEARMCLPTDYAVANGTKTSSDYKLDGYPTAAWWLRSPGTTQYYAALVSSGGSLGYGNVSNDIDVVRPAFWMNLESGN